MDIFLVCAISTILDDRSFNSEYDVTSGYVGGVVDVGELELND